MSMEYNEQLDNENTLTRFEEMLSQKAFFLARQAIHDAEKAERYELVKTMVELYTQATVI